MKISNKFENVFIAVLMISQATNAICYQINCCYGCCRYEKGWQQVEFGGWRDLKPYLQNGFNVCVSEISLTLYTVGILYTCVAWI